MIHDCCEEKTTTDRMGTARYSEGLLFRRFEYRTLFSFSINEPYFFFGRINLRNIEPCFIFGITNLRNNEPLE